MEKYQWYKKAFIQTVYKMINFEVEQTSNKQWTNVFLTHLVDHIVGQVLVQVGQGVGVLGQRVILAPQLVAGRYLPELVQVNHVYGADVVLPIAQVPLPVPALPKPETVHFFSVVAEWRVAVRISCLFY